MIDFKNVSSRFWKGARLWNENRGFAEVEAAVQELIDDACQDGRRIGYEKGLAEGFKWVKPLTFNGTPIECDAATPAKDSEEALLNRIVALEDTNAALVDILHGLVCQD